MRLALLPLAVAVALASAASAQRIEPDILFTDFDDNPARFSFGDDQAGIAIVAGAGEYGTDALRGNVSPSGGSAGFAVDRSALDASAAEALVFLVRSTVTDANASGGRTDTVVLEVKLGQGGVEYTAFRELAPAAGYQWFSIPISAFRNGGSSFDASAVTRAIFAFGGVTGPDFSFDVENIGFVTSPVVNFNDFDDGDFTNDNLITFTQSGTGIGRPADGPGADGTPNALIVDYNGATAGEFAVAQFGTPGGGTVDASATSFFEFLYRDEDDGTAVNLILIDADGDQYFQTVSLPSGTGYQQVSLSLSSFSDNPEGDGVLDELQTVKIEIGDRGDGPSTLSLDQFEFRARRGPATQTIADGAGWRLLSPPVSGLTVGDLASQNLVQGVAGSYPDAADNVYTSYEGGATDPYTPATSTADGLIPGTGFFWYLFDQPIDAPGSSDSFPTPFTVFGQGDIATADVTVLRTLNDDGFYMMGNPYDQPLMLNGISVSDGSLQTAFSAYDPNAGATGSYVTRTDAETVAVWQGVFAQVNGGTGDPTFTYDADARVSPAAPPFYGRRAEAARVAFDLRVSDGNIEFADLSAMLRFEPDARAGWDRHDLSKLTPPAPQHALAAFEGVGPDGDAGLLAVLALPTVADAPIDVPLAVTATQDGTFVLSWAGDVPEGLTAELIDGDSGDRLDLAAPGQYEGAVVDGTADTPLALRIAPVSATSIDADADTDWVGGPQPNPASQAVAVPVRLATSQTIRAVLYDVLGRQVAVAADGDRSAGASVVRADVANLAPGVYVLRIEGDQFAASRRITVTR